MQESIRYNQYQGTGTMEKSAGFSVDRSNNSDGALHIKAIDYLRLQDILASHKSRQKKKNRRRNSIKNNQFTGERKGFYTKTIYQNLNPIIWDLSFGFTQEVIQDIRKRFSEYIIKP
jgi:hypothetical protein